MERRDLRTLTLVLSAMVAIDALAVPVILLAALTFPEAYAANVMPIANQVDTGTIIFNVATIIVFCRWIYVAGKNLVAAGYDDLEFTPGSRIWWFAVPIACLFKPFQGMRELWNASRGETHYAEGSGLIATWWALWLLTGFMGYFSRVLTAQPDSGTIPFWIQSAVDVPLAVVVIIMINRISEGQSRLSEPALAEVFA